MVKVYGIVKRQGFCIGNEDTKTFIGTYTKSTASKILMDSSFIQRWNDNHIASISRLVFEFE